MLSPVCNAQRCKGGDGANVGRCTYYRWLAFERLRTVHNCQSLMLQDLSQSGGSEFSRTSERIPWTGRFFPKSLHLLLCTCMGLVVVHEINFPALHAYANVSSCSTVPPFQVRILPRALPCCSSFSSFKGSGGHCRAFSILHSWDFEISILSANTERRQCPCPRRLLLSLDHGTRSCLAWYVVESSRFISLKTLSSSRAWFMYIFCHYSCGLHPSEDVINL
jgi:hypothetical protein